MPFPDADHATIGNHVANKKRPTVEGMVIPSKYKALMRQCWAQKPDDRPRFSSIVLTLQEMLAQ